MHTGQHIFCGRKAQITVGTLLPLNAMPGRLIDKGREMTKDQRSNSKRADSSRTSPAKITR